MARHDTSPVRISNSVMARVRDFSDRAKPHVTRQGIIETAIEEYLAKAEKNGINVIKEGNDPYGSQSKSADADAPVAPLGERECYMKKTRLKKRKKAS